MSTTITTPICDWCGSPIREPVVTWVGSKPCHSDCALKNGPTWSGPHYTAPFGGSKPLQPLTEEDVRRIVREELSRKGPI